MVADYRWLTLLDYLAAACIVAMQRQSVIAWSSKADNKLLATIYWVATYNACSIITRVCRRVRRGVRSTDAHIDTRMSICLAQKFAWAHAKRGTRVLRLTCGWFVP